MKALVSLLRLKVSEANLLEFWFLMVCSALDALAAAFIA